MAVTSPSGPALDGAGSAGGLFGPAGLFGLVGLEEWSEIDERYR